MNFNSVLEKYRKNAFSERDKGTRFEVLIKYYLKTDPMYSNDYENIWLWSEFPFREQFGGKDTGIDLVAKSEDGKYTAIQCKCYDEKTSIDKAEVDTFLSTSGKYFTDENNETVNFSYRLWVSTTNKWSAVAEDTLKNQNPPVNRISLTMLENAEVDWKEIDKGIYGEPARSTKKTLRAHQQTALEKTHEYFVNNDRGKLIMACGTGKTYTSLKIAENETKNNGTVLFLVPSIALLGQTLNEWVSQADKQIHPICICSDPTSTQSKKKKDDNSEEFSVVDLARPASTNVENIRKQFLYIQKTKKEGMTVVFSTYQSIDVIAKAQASINAYEPDSCIFDLVICDEAHRTTGVILNGGQEETAFTKVHDNNIIKAKKRLYMTATPRLYNENAKDKAKENNAILCSMDDASIYGEEIYRIGFGEAVEKNLLSDYKVLVLTLSEKDIPQTLQNAVSNPNLEITADDATKLVGCINSLSKRVATEITVNGELKNELTQIDPGFMHKAVAFCPTIKASKGISEIFNTHGEEYYDSLTHEERQKVVSVSAAHVDGSMGASTRDEKLAWLKSTPTDGDECRILTNVRCLSEGVDVPSLDAILFLSAKNSQVDVVQSVGRVMRKAEGKKYGYIIIPVIIPSDVTPEEALDNNERFKVVWTVLNALRAHDDRFNAMVNKIDLNKKKNEKVLVTTLIGQGEKESSGSDSDNNGDKQQLSERMISQLKLQFGELQDTVYAKMVQKVGSRKYWEQWAKDIAKIAETHVKHINDVLEKSTESQKEFDTFLKGLQKQLNPSITKDEAIEMLAQHLITRPVFEALFENYSFVKNNPVSIAMQRILDILDANAIDKGQEETLGKFYKSVRERAEGVDNSEGKQKIIIELYDKFFKTALPKTVEKLGIVYTPVEVVDFILNSVSDVLKKEFNRTLSDENIHILDPFTGTGTFITRLLQGGFIKPEDLKRKYKNEIHANEIVLLAYYIASINIENTYHDLINAKEDEYESFDGICLTDTFQMTEYDEKLQLSDVFPQNSERVEKQKKCPLTVIVGNPPYSAGQKSKNDNAKNQKYEKLDKKILTTYVEESKNNSNSNSLKKFYYDPYIKAFRWSSDRINRNGGIIAFVSNGGWIDSNSLDGFRSYIEKEFSSIYVFNLRGNQVTSGDLSKREGGKIFGSGSRTPIAITILVKNSLSKNNKTKIYYHDIGDYLSREEKLKIISGFGSIYNKNFQMEVIKPNDKKDWINQRGNLFESLYEFAPDKKGNKKSKSIFTINTNGIVSGRSNWVYNFSYKSLKYNVKNMIEFFNEQVEKYKNVKVINTLIKVEDFINRDDTKIKWDDKLMAKVSNGIKLNLENDFRIGYRTPFCKENVYFNNEWNWSRVLLPKLLPSINSDNLIISCIGKGASRNFSALITNTIMDYHFEQNGQCFPLYWYEEKKENTVPQMNLFDNQNEDKDKYIRHDGITDFIHQQAKEKYGHKVTKEDIFYYVYGILHSEDYRTKFAADLKKMLPRIPLVDKTDDFWAFSNAGRDLAKLHLNYEDQAPLSSVKVYGEESGNFKVTKMKFKCKEDKSEIIYNDSIKVSNIPIEAYEYIVNGKSAIEWLIERYQKTIDNGKNGSMIKNDPNDWAEEHNQPRYILDLLLSVISLSVATVKIVKSLPKLEFKEDK